MSFSIVSDFRFLTGTPRYGNRHKVAFQGGDSFVEVGVEPLSKPSLISCTQTTYLDGGMIMRAGENRMRERNFQCFGETLTRLLEDVEVRVSPTDAKIPLPERKDSGIDRTIDFSDYRIHTVSRSRKSQRRGAIETGARHLQGAAAYCNRLRRLLRIGQETPRTHSDERERGSIKKITAC